MLLWLWQLPQNIIGFFLTRKKELSGIGSVGEGICFNVYYKKNFWGSGVCLGDYIILDHKYLGKSDRTDQKHEYGHHLQSVKLGWLYLIIIGLPSIVFNIYDRIFQPVCHSVPEKIHDNSFYLKFISPDVHNIFARINSNLLIFCG